MIQNPDIRGIIGYLVTPFGEDGRGVATSTLRHLVNVLINNGVHAIAPLGSTGEIAYLSESEWQEVAEATVTETAGRVPTILGASALTTETVVRRAKFAEQIGASAVMIVPVSYWKLSEQEIFEHYRTVARQLSIPIMVYNNPGTSGVDMRPEFLVRLAREIDQVTMVKESSGDIQRMHCLYELTDGALPFFNGCNPLALEAFAAGARGWCTAAVNLIPELNLQLFEATQAGDLDAARRLFYRQLPILRFILTAGGLPATIKAGLKLLQIDAGEPRPPLKPLDAASVERLKDLLTAVNQDLSTLALAAH